MGRIYALLVKYPSDGVLLFNEKYVNHSHVAIAIKIYLSGNLRGTLFKRDVAKSFPRVTHGKSDVNQSHESLMGLVT